MYLYLVRHGQSTGNLRQLFYGVRDYPLTELGREQDLLRPDWSFHHGAYSAVRVDEPGAELVQFNR